MVGLRQADLLGALEVVRRVEDVPTLEAFRQAAMTALLQLLAADQVAYNEIDPRHGVVHVAANPASSLTPAVLEAYDRFYAEHPAVQFVGRTGDRATPLKISDFLTQRQFHRLHLYDEVFRVAGLEHQIAVVLDDPGGLIVGIPVNRGRRDFSERDRELLALLRPHLTAARLHAQQREELAALERWDAGRRAVVLITPRGSSRPATGTAENLLARYFPGRQRGGALPEELATWARERWAGDPAAELAEPCPPLTVEASDRRLTVWFVPRRSPGDADALIFEERRAPLTAERLRSCGLTTRQVEVLKLAGAGLVDKQIAYELGISVRTVRKHLEHIFARLGVHNRTAALARAMELSDATV